MVSIALFFKLFFLRRNFSIFFEFRTILRSFGRPKWRPKSIFGHFFFDAFFECVSASILYRFWEARNLKNSNFPMEKQRFSQNRRFRKKCERISILELFSEAKTTKNREKIVLKNMYFFEFHFLAFFFDFWRFWLDFGRPRDVQKLAKNRKNRVRDGFGTRLGSSIDLGHDFRAILVDFGRIWDGFLKDFGKIFGRI